MKNEIDMIERIPFFAQALENTALTVNIEIKNNKDEVVFTHYGAMKAKNYDEAKANLKEFLNDPDFQEFLKLH